MASRASWKRFLRLSLVSVAAKLTRHPKKLRAEDEGKAIEIDMLVSPEAIAPI